MAAIMPHARCLPRHMGLPWATVHVAVRYRYRLSLNVTEKRSVATAAAQLREPHVQPGSTCSSIDNPLRDSRFERLRNAPPFSSFLTDSFNRQHTYLRISITERCNLRCTYCMPEAGVPLSPENDNLTTPEILLLSELFVSQGVNKIRLTGGEPTIRKDILSLMRRLGDLRSKGLKEMALTTNGVALWRKLDAMAEAGLTGVNLSLDTLDPHLFQIITRRKGFEAVIKSMDRIQELNKLGAGIKLKINCVITRGVNDREILDFVELGREKEIEIRFIEYMPFDGNKWEKKKMFSYEEMLQVIRTRYPQIRRLHDKSGETSKTWQIPGFVGKVGFITSMTENFCGTCNRLRITSDGNLKVCLFGNSEVSLRDLLRENAGGEPIDEVTYEAMRELENSTRVGSEGFPAVLRDSLRERDLLDVIGQAVGRKKARHAGMENLSSMPNRPMILIDYLQQSFQEALRPDAASVLGVRGPQAHRSHCMALFRKQDSEACNRSYSMRRFSTSAICRRNHPRPVESPFCKHIEGLNKARNLSATQRAPQDSHGGMPRSLPHLTANSTVHMVSVGEKEVTSREAMAVGLVRFTSADLLSAIRKHSLKKGDVLAVARIAAIMGAKRTSDIVPLCHPGLQITKVEVEVEAVDGMAANYERMAKEKAYERAADATDEAVKSLARRWLQSRIGTHGGVRITAKVACSGKTGVEMEALTAVSAAALTVVDMCKAVDKGMSIEGIKMVYKTGGRSGTYLDESWSSE